MKTVPRPPGSPAAQAAQQRLEPDYHADEGVMAYAAKAKGNPHEKN
jgi:hypothetical protein